MNDGRRWPALIAALSNADVAVGSRYVPSGGIDAWTWLRRLISAGGNLFARVALGLHTRESVTNLSAK